MRAPLSRPIRRRAASRGGAALLVLLALAAAGCRQGSAAPAAHVAGGDPDRGRIYTERYGCGFCHVIPGIEGANGQVGAPLTHFARRRYIAGALLNESENLVRWLVDPQAVEPGTAMPALGIPEAHARDIAAYLYTIGEVVPLGPPHVFSPELLKH